jgi:hypothetical protein
MTNKEKALQLADLVRDEGRTPAERKAAWSELLAVKKAAKTSLEKLGISGASVRAAWLKACELESLRVKPIEDDPLDEPAAPAAKPKPAKDGRGLITAEVKRLLRETDLAYAAIVEAVVALHPDAKTTTRSVASVASDMRKAKEAVAIRRPAAKA